MRYAKEHVLIGHRNTVNSVLFSPHDRVMVSCGEDGDIIFWDIESGFEIDRLQNDLPALLIAWIFASGDVGIILACALYDTSIVLWPIQASYLPFPKARYIRNCPKRFVPYENASKISMLVSDGEYMAVSAGGAVNMYRFHGSERERDPTQTTDIEPPQKSCEWSLVSNTRTSLISHVSFSPERKVVYICYTYEKTIVEVDFLSGEELRRLNLADTIGSAALSPSGGHLSVYNTKTGLDFINTRGLWKTNIRLNLSVSTRPSIFSVFIDEGTVVCHDEEHDLHIWDVDTRRVLQTFDHNWGRVTCLMAQPLGHRGQFAVGYADSRNIGVSNAIVIWTKLMDSMILPDMAITGGVVPCLKATKSLTTLSPPSKIPLTVQQVTPILSGSTLAHDEKLIQPNGLELHTTPSLLTDLTRVLPVVHPDKDDNGEIGSSMHLDVSVSHPATISLTFTATLHTSPNTDSKLSLKAIVGRPKDMHAEYELIPTDPTEKTYTKCNSLESMIYGISSTESRSVEDILSGLIEKRAPEMNDVIQGIPPPLDAPRMDGESPLESNRVDASKSDAESKSWSPIWPTDKHNPITEESLESVELDVQTQAQIHEAIINPTIDEYMGKPELDTAVDSQAVILHPSHDYVLKATARAVLLFFASVLCTLFLPETVVIIL